MAKRRAGTVTLNADDLATGIGTALLNLLERVTADGALSDEEIQELRAWLLVSASADAVPGMQFLREEIDGVLADGVVSDNERRLLRNAVLRVLPITQRDRAKTRIADAMKHERDEAKARAVAEQEEADRWASPAQAAYIRDLGGSCPEGTTRNDASALIDQLLAIRPTARQRMVLRFWDRLELMSAGVDGVSAWMDSWYAEDPKRREAWELWKRESQDNDRRSHADVEIVPIGAGAQYLARVTAGAAAIKKPPSLLGTIAAAFGFRKPV